MEGYKTVRSDTMTNITTTEPAVDNITEDMYWIIIALGMSIAWFIYLAFYNSRVIGLILTIILNKFINFGHIKFGSFSVSILSGKIMFRDIHIVTEDYSLHIYFGWIILRWWKPYIVRDLKEDMSHSETRMSIFLDGVEFHLYNRHQRYAELARLFNIDLGDEVLVKKPPKKPETKHSFQWRDFIPVIKLEINTGRLVFGNYRVPSTLIVSWEEAQIVYTTKPASTPFDLYMHTLKCHLENLRVLLVPSPKYTGPIDEPPRFMGEGFVVLQSNKSDVYFYMDEPGLVPYEPEIVQLADGEVIVSRTWPCCGMDVTCGKGTDIFYGPWADRQRDYLWKMFLPADYELLEETKVSEPGQTRQHRNFEFKMNLITKAVCDILFTKNKETQAIHLNFGQGTYIESTIPLMTEETGYTSKINGQLMLLNGTTSLKYSPFIDCETLEFAVTAKFPCVWNDHQDWTLDVTACKATLWLIYQHTHYLSDLMNDWASKSPPDLYAFVPYTWTINLLIKQFELITLANEFNWIDTATAQQQNAHLAFCGDMLDLSVQLPFIDFLPTLLPLKIFIRVETVDCCIYLPECNTSRHTAKTLGENAKITDREGNIMTEPFCYNKEGKWRSFTAGSDWLDCATTNIVAISMIYTYHPMHIQYQKPRDYAGEHFMSFEEEEEDVLRHLRPTTSENEAVNDFDPTSLDPDLVRVELEVGPCSVRLFGSLVRLFLNVKENYFGEDVMFHDSRESQERSEPHLANLTGFTNQVNPDEVHYPEDLRAYRPFSVKVSLTLHDIHAHLLRNCSLEDPPCPSVYIDRVGFEMDKTFLETKLQVVLSPAVIVATDNAKRPLDQRTLKYGHLGLTGLQVRGHSLFSHNGLAVDSETLEYAWLLELTAGDITGKLTTIQLQNIVEFAMTFSMLMEDAENRVFRSKVHYFCQHMIPRHHCHALSKYPYPCPTADDLKYRMTRASLDSMNVFICETDSAINLQVHPARLATCNLHGVSTRAGITACLDHIHLKQLISTNTHDKSAPDIWLECGGISFGPMNFEAAMALPRFQDHALQHDFLTLHDGDKRRLWFLWQDDERDASVTCGCLGNCNFFGSKKSAQTQYFKVSKETFRNRATAVFSVNPDPTLFGFGQSILHKNKLLFDVTTAIVPESQSQGKRLSVSGSFINQSHPSPDSPLTDVSPLDDLRAFSPECAISSELQKPVHIIKETTIDITSTKPLSSSLRDTSVFHRRSFDNKRVSIASEDGDKTDARYNQFRSSTSSPNLDQGLQRRSIYSSARDRFGSVSSNASFRSARTSFSHATSRRSIASSKSAYYSCNSSPSLHRVRSATSVESEYFSVVDSDDTTADDIEVESDMSPTGPYIDDNREDNSPKVSDIDPSDELDAELVSLPSTFPSNPPKSSNDSISTTSSVSDDVDFPDDLNLVDLHSQMNQPISKSPVLMSCYASHLTQLRCFDWTCLPPVPYLDLQFLNVADPVAANPSSLPRFTLHKTGFSVNSMSAKQKEPTIESPDSDDASKTHAEMADEMDLRSHDNVSKTMAVVKLKDSFNVLVTPLLLESIQRFVEVVTPLLSVLHPSSIIDYLHGRCLDKLQLQNKLVKEDSRTQDSTASGDLLDMAEKTTKECDRKSYSLKALINIPQININILQSSIVEEVISFSALDRIYEAACVSLLGICINDINVQMMYNTHRKKVTMDDTISRKLSSSKKQELQESDVDLEKPSEITRQESIGKLHIGHVHCQLRRLAKGSNFNERIILAAIPNNKSKVLFTYDYEKYSHVEHNKSTARLHRQFSRESSITDKSDGFGYIMFECGIEDVTLTAIRRLGYQNTTNTPVQEKMLEMERIIRDIRESGRTKFDIENEIRKYRQTMRNSMGKRQSLQYAISSTSLISDSSGDSHSDETIIDGKNPLVGDAASVNLVFNGVWFSFASPPQLAKKRKADFTRVDWNLLSTVTPAINAWLNPSHRLMVAVNELVQTVSHRTSSIMACVMTEALEVQGIHLPFKTKFNKLTALAEMLQEDPSCQMFTVLRKYLALYGTERVELAVKAETIPQLITIQKGILALTRQWKNILYMPNLASSFNTKKRQSILSNVKTIVPAPPLIEVDEQDDEVEILTDNADDRTLLLQTDCASVKYSSHQSLAKRESFPRANTSVVGDQQSAYSEHVTDAGSMLSSLYAKQRRHKPHPDIVPSTSYTPGMTDAFTSTTPAQSNTKHLESGTSVTSASNASLDHPLSPHTSPFKQVPVSSKHQRSQSGGSDLYRWMAKQQEDMKFPSYDRSVPRQDSFVASIMNAWNQEDSHLDVNQEPETMFTSIQQLANAQILFKPFLQSIGLHIESVRSSAIMKKFGGNLSMKGTLNTLKVEIIESDDGVKASAKNKAKYSILPGTPVLICRAFSVNVALKDLLDFESSDSSNDRVKGTSQNIKFAMHKLETKPATTVLNGTIDVDSVSLFVDMALMRLTNQFHMMIGNVSDTRAELKYGGENSEWLKTHRKQDSKDSSSSTSTGASHGPEAQNELGSAAVDTKPTQLSHKPKQSPIPVKKTVPKKREEAKFLFDKFTFGQIKKTTKEEKLLPPKADSIHPLSLNLKDAANSDVADTSSPLIAEKTIIDEISDNTPQCWRNLYHLLDLYSTMPETKTVGHRPESLRLSTIQEESSDTTSLKKQKVPTYGQKDASEKPAQSCPKTADGGEQGIAEKFLDDPSLTSGLAHTTLHKTSFKQSIFVGESIPLVVMAVAKVKIIKVQAALSGLKLHAEMNNAHVTGTYKEKVKGVMKRKTIEWSSTQYIGLGLIDLLEGILPSMKTVVKVNVSPSYGLFTSVTRRGKAHNSALCNVGMIDIDIPQQPIILHGMVTRGSREISTTLSELMWNNKLSKGSESGDVGAQQSLSDESTTQDMNVRFHQPVAKTAHTEDVIHITAVLEGWSIGAALLPSLKAFHKTQPITLSGVTGKRAKFTVDLPLHSISFKSKVTLEEASIPSSAIIELPRIHMFGDFRVDEKQPARVDGLMVLDGNYLNLIAEVGLLEHTLTTDVLNHLVFVQKVFVKELNEIFQKVSGTSEKPSAFSSQEVTTPRKPLKVQKAYSKPILFSVSLRLKGIQVTATTPSSSAVRLETERIDVEITNRIYIPSPDGRNHKPSPDTQKVFIKAVVDLSTVLGQLLKNPLFEEAEAEFHTMAFFKTKIAVRNAHQDEIIPGKGGNQEVLLISLTRPIVLAHPLAFDQAVMVWLNYRHAYEYWSEQRLSLNMEVQSAMKEIDKIAMMTDFTQSLRALFIQLNVDDIGICVPLDSPERIERERMNRPVDLEAGPALVLTIETSQVSACSFGSLVSKGKFTGFCLRFAGEFDTSWDDWKPDPRQAPIMNVVEVPDGTYEVCSRTISPLQIAEPYTNAKWILNVRWDMKGVDVQVDTNISKCLSALGHTLTALAGEREDLLMDTDADVLDRQSSDPTLSESYSDMLGSGRRSFLSDLPAFVTDTSMEPKVRARLLETHMNQQARLVQDLKELGAKESTLAVEILKLDELKMVISNDFRRDVVNKLKKHGERASVIKDKLGLSSGRSKDHYRSKSYGGLHSYSSKPLLESTSRDEMFDQSLSYRSIFSETGPLIVASSDSSTSSISQDMADPAPSPVDDPRLIISHPALATPSICRLESQDPNIAVYAALPPGCLIDSSHSLPDDDRSENHDVFDDDYDLYRLKHLSDTTLKSTSHYMSSMSMSGSMSKTITEPVIDFELDINVFIDTGKCVLNPKEALGRDVKDDDVKSHLASKNKKGKKLIGVEMLSKSKVTKSDSNLMGKNQRSQIAKTILFIPSVNVKEMVIGPSILDFLEQVLDPIDKITNQFMRKANLTPSENRPSREMTDVPVAAISTTSFPVDVMVFMRIDPSIVRFNCLPVSRVECLLQLPSLDIIFSTNRSGIDGHGLDSEMSFTQHGKHATTFDFEPSMKTSISSLDSITTTSSGGLNVSAFTSEFSMYIFHPYGGRQPTTSTPTPNTSSADSKQSGESCNLSSSTITMSTKPDPQRRDSLSLKVAFVKVNISRSRKLDVCRNDITKQSEKSNIVRFSTLIDVGGSTFQYDMRRLSEILSFPKSWYRRTLARRLFLGDESMNIQSDSTSALFNPLDTATPPESPLSKYDTDPSLNVVRPDVTQRHHRRLSSSDKFRFLVGAEKLRYRGDRKSATTLTAAPQIESDNTAKQRDTRGTTLGENQAACADTSKVTDTNHMLYNWETVVLFALNFSKLSIDINMSNLMGVINWVTDDLSCSGRFAISSTGLKNVSSQCGFQQSTFEAKGGVIGGVLNLLQATAFVYIMEDPQENKEPLHQLGATLRCIETRIDYMGSSVLMVRSNEISIGIHDEWRREAGTPDYGVVPLCNNRPAMIFIHTDLSWDQLHIMISRATTPELMKIHIKLEEFFANQFASSRRLFSGGAARHHPSLSRPKESDSVTFELQHHRHWQSVLEDVIGCQFAMLPSPLPTEGTILGGFAKLTGHNTSLACYHGVNFRSKTWALFVLHEPHITFETEAQSVHQSDDTRATHIVQNFVIILGGHQSSRKASDDTMATICKMSRGQYNPPPFTTIQDWFQYTFACSEIKDCGVFPTMPWNFPDDVIEVKKVRSSKSHVYSHEAEIIFLFPYMQVHLKTEHLQLENSPEIDDEPAKVKCTFVSEFEGHIFVVMDIEVLLFVHDLIQSYIKEKSRGTKSTLSKSSETQNKEEKVEEKAEAHVDDKVTGKSQEKIQEKRLDPTAALKQDRREFECVTFQLEPTVRLFHWARQQIDPVGADYVLHKLGFVHARETIPKWMQRGAMDPLDKMLSMLMHKLIVSLRVPQVTHEGGDEVAS